MLNWKEQFVAKKTALINRNGEYESPKLLHLDPDWSYIDFLNAASNRLDLAHSAKRVFNSNGVEIDDCMMIEDDDRLFLSQGEAYLNPRINIGMKHDDNSSHSSVSNKHIREKATDKSRFSIASVGPYTVGEVLGRGGFGEVREGTNQVTGEKVALKFIKKSEIQSMGAVERAAVEIKCQSILRHQNIIKLEMNLETNKYIVLAFELMRGGDLGKYLTEKGPSSTLSEDSARHAFQQILAGVSYAHNNNIIHRDLKLENILLKDRTLENLKIADFGLSEFYRPGGLLSSTSGTLSYQAPEVVSGISHAGPPLDVWAIGVILFTMLCGRLPFEGSRLNMSKRPMEAIIKEKIIKCQYTMTDSLSNDAKDLVKRMLCPDPSKRASIPDILSHRWMRSESYIRRVSFPQPAPSAGLAEDTFASIAQILQPPNPTEGRLNELSVPVSSCSDGFASYHSPDSRLFNPTEDPSFSTLLRVEVDVAAAATAATTAATTITKSVLPSDGSLSNSSYDTQSDASSTWNCRSFSIDNTADVSGFSMSQCSAISHKSNGGSVRMRSPRGHLISDSHSGAPSTSWHTVETSFSVSSLNTPMATPGATPRLGSLYQDGGHCESMSAESSQSEKMRLEPPREYGIGESPIQDPRGPREGLFSPNGSSDYNNGRRFSDVSHTHSSYATEPGQEGAIKSVPLFQLVPLRRRNKEGAVPLNLSGIHSRTSESDSEDTVKSASPLRPIRDNSRSPLLSEGKRVESGVRSLVSGGLKGRKDNLKSKPRSMQPSDGSGKYRPNSILPIEEQPSQHPASDSDSVMDVQRKHEEEAKERDCALELPSTSSSRAGDSSKESGRILKSQSPEASSTLTGLGLGPVSVLGLGLGLGLESSVSNDTQCSKIITTASTSSASSLGSATFFGKCLPDLDTQAIGTGEGGGGGGDAVSLSHKGIQHPP